MFETVSTAKFWSLPHTVCAEGPARWVRVGTAETACTEHRRPGQGMEMEPATEALLILGNAFRDSLIRRLPFWLGSVLVHFYWGVYFYLSARVSAGVCLCVFEKETFSTWPMGVAQ